ncbi:molybdenum cofactor guanylyltransferase MobA [Magnetovibrio sp. PR-2]|uniref:molybdenum cofactor guanylyltransferase MobA n=1 Tax=Magnetovibrio sp. PR-2 TaxID=3120356 RepID=UPI002FCE5907
MNSKDICGLILAGGNARRMGGGAKGAFDLAGQNLIDHVTQRIQPQVSHTLIMSNEPEPEYIQTGLPIVADEIKQAGPLAGISAGMNYIHKLHPDCQRMIVVTVDCPFVPLDLVQVLNGPLSAGDADIAYVGVMGRAHPLISLWSMNIRNDLNEDVRSGKARKVFSWIKRHHSISVEWQALPIDPFFNINRPDDLMIAEHLVRLVRSMR